MCQDTCTCKRMDHSVRRSRLASVGQQAHMHADMQNASTVPWRLHRSRSGCKTQLIEVWRPRKHCTVGVRMPGPQHSGQSSTRKQNAKNVASSSPLHPSLSRKCRGSTAMAVGCRSATTMPRTGQSCLIWALENLCACARAASSLPGRHVRASDV